MTLPKLPTELLLEVLSHLSPLPATDHLKTLHSLLLTSRSLHTLVAENDALYRPIAIELGYPPTARLTDITASTWKAAVKNAHLWRLREGLNKIDKTNSRPRRTVGSIGPAKLAVAAGGYVVSRDVREFTKAGFLLRLGMEEKGMPLQVPGRRDFVAPGIVRDGYEGISELGTGRKWELKHREAVKIRVRGDMMVAQLVNQIVVGIEAGKGEVWRHELREGWLERRNDWAPYTKVHDFQLNGSHAVLLCGRYNNDHFTKLRETVFIILSLKTGSIISDNLIFPREPSSSQNSMAWTSAFDFPFLLTDTHIISGGQGGELLVWRYMANTSYSICCKQLRKPCVGLSRDGRYFGYTTHDRLRGTLTILDMHSGRVESVWHDPRAPHTDGLWLWDGKKAMYWTAETGAGRTEWYQRLYDSTKKQIEGLEWIFFQGVVGLVLLVEPTYWLLRCIFHRRTLKKLWKLLDRQFLERAVRHTVLTAIVTVAAHYRHASMLGAAFGLLGFKLWGLKTGLANAMDKDIGLIVLMLVMYTKFTILLVPAAAIWAAAEAPTKVLVPAVVVGRIFGAMMVRMESRRTRSSSGKGARDLLYLVNWWVGFWAWNKWGKTA